jgi:hypothetical protein
MYGKFSDEGGIVSETTINNTASDNKTVISNEAFSSESGGSIKPRHATAVISMHGHIRLIM